MILKFWPISSSNELLKLLIQKLELDSERVVFFWMGVKSNFFKSEHPSYKNLKNSTEKKKKGPGSNYFPAS